MNKEKNAIENLKPDILVVGNDWDKIKCQEFLEKMGRKVIFFHILLM